MSKKTSTPEAEPETDESGAAAPPALPTDLAALERATSRASHSQQEIASMRQSLEVAIRNLMEDNDVFMVSLTFVHKDGHGATSAVLRNPPTGVPKESPEWKGWEAAKRASLVHCCAYLKTGYDSLTRMVMDLMQRGV